MPCSFDDCKSSWRRFELEIDEFNGWWTSYTGISQGNIIIINLNIHNFDEFIWNAFATHLTIKKSEKEKNSRPKIEHTKENVLLLLLLQNGKLTQHFDVFFLSFVQINPQHTIPTLNDDGFSLWESRAIQVYLVEKYGKTDSLYPTDPKKRALVNQRLYFDLGTLYQRYADYYYPQLFAKAPANPENFKKLEDAVGFLNTFLEGQKYAAGETLTVADISLVATISTFDVSGFDLTKYPNVVSWYEKCKSTIPGYELNEAGAQEFKAKFFS